MKKTRKLLSLLLCVCLLFSVTATVFAEETTKEDATSEAEIFKTPPKAALLYDRNSGETLYELNADEKNYPASLTKIMTCMLALEHGNIEDILTVSQSAVEGMNEAGSTADLLVGEQLPLLELLYCVMVSSANEACNVVAEHISGSVDGFVDLMNQTAQELGCTGTHFANPHGLHNEEHFTTARDMAIITRKALENERFFQICNTIEHTVPATNLSPERKLYTTNKLISNSSAASAYRYSKAAGVKTGFTTPAGRCIISTADNNNLHLLAVIMGAPQYLDEATGSWVERSFPECINLFEYGFNNFINSTVLSTLYPIAEIPVNLSAEAHTVALAPTEDIRILINADYDPDEIIKEIHLDSQSVDAPVEVGQVLGSVTVTYHGNVLGVRDLAAIASVKHSETAYATREIKTYTEENWWKWLLGIVIAFAVVLVVLVIILQIHRRQKRKRKMLARRRALERRLREQQM